MKKNNFPNKIPIFPLSSAIFFPICTLCCVKNLGDLGEKHMFCKTKLMTAIMMFASGAVSAQFGNHI